jgi:hypothetical protein
MSNRVSTPAAILIGSAMMSIALYLGLQSRGTTEPAPSPRPIAATPELYARVAADATKGLDNYRPAMSAACLQGSTKPLRFKFQMGFNERGKELIRGISLDGDGPADVPTCLTDHFPPAIVVPAPGVKVSVIAPLELP